MKRKVNTNRFAWHVFQGVIIMDWLEHKLFVLHLNGERLSLQAVAPMNDDEHVQASNISVRDVVIN
jgi:hypothetical protein